MLHLTDKHNLLDRLELKMYLLLKHYRNMTNFLVSWVYMKSHGVDILSTLIFKCLVRLNINHFFSLPNSCFVMKFVWLNGWLDIPIANSFITPYFFISKRRQKL